MSATITGWQPRRESGVLSVVTRTAVLLSITKWTDVEKDSLRYFLVRAGYASTIHKAQGGVFEHITLYCDAEQILAAGYISLSR
eukprot:3431443-Karenia_brevis.AAC.1